MGWSKGAEAQNKASAEMAGEVLEVAQRIRPLLAGHHPSMQAAVLAELVSEMVGAIRDPEDPFGPPDDDLKAARRDFYANFTDLIWDLVRVDDEAWQRIALKLKQRKASR